MKKHLDFIPAFLLIASLLFFSINGFTLQASIVVAVLSIMFGYQQYLFRTEQPDLKKELEISHTRLENELKSFKADYLKNMERFEDEVSKVALSASRMPSVQVKKERDKIIF